MYLMKEATKRLISNETSQDRSIRLKDAATRFAAKISNKKSPERASQLEKHDFESPESLTTHKNSTTSQGQCRKLRLRYLCFR
jgi:hypothetical protein